MWTSVRIHQDTDLISHGNQTNRFERDGVYGKKNNNSCNKQQQQQKDENNGSNII